MYKVNKPFDSLYLGQLTVLLLQSTNKSQYLVYIVNNLIFEFNCFLFLKTYTYNLVRPLFVHLRELL